jgi:hypothetical protein
LGIYYKRNSYTDEADFLGILPISAMTNIRNLFSQTIRKVSRYCKTKNLAEKNKALDEQTQRATVTNLKRVQLSKDSVVCMPKAFYGNTNTR